MLIFVSRLIEQLVYPPGGPLILIVIALLLPTAWRASRFILLTLGVGTLYLLGIPAITAVLMSTVETYPPIPPENLPQMSADAIVVLGGGRYHDAPEYGGSTSNAVELERLRYANFLQLKTGIPIAVIGGDGLNTGIAEADLMQAVLSDEFRAKVKWNDGRSTNTIDNARFAWEMMSKDGASKILLVTHATHMPRSVALFRAAGFEVTPAPTSFYRPGVMESGPMAFVPSAGAMRLNNRVLHEWVGMVWNAGYQLVKRLDWI
jgi:uncharacterized SAM-binding protein YcdF (DUF218 family)